MGYPHAWIEKLLTWIQIDRETSTSCTRAKNPKEDHTFKAFEQPHIRKEESGEQGNSPSDAYWEIRVLPAFFEALWFCSHDVKSSIFNFRTNCPCKYSFLDENKRLTPRRDVPSYPKVPHNAFSSQNPTTRLLSWQLLVYNAWLTSHLHPSYSKSRAWSKIPGSQWKKAVIACGDLKLDPQ